MARPTRATNQGASTSSTDAQPKARKSTGGTVVRPRIEEASSSTASTSRARKTGGRAQTQNETTPTKKIRPSPMSASQVSTTSSARRKKKPTPKKNDNMPYSPMKKVEFNKLVHNTVYYFLIEEQKKLPIKSQDIKKHVFDQMTRTRHKFKNVLDEARDYLDKVFGMKVVTVPNVKQEQFILVSTCTDTDMPREYTDTKYAHRSLLVLVLAIIYMCNYNITEEELWKTLKLFDVYPEKLHPLFGDVKKLLTQELKKQLYVEYELIENSEPPAYQFNMGFRAQCEMNERKVLEYVSKIYGTEPKNFTAQYKQLKDDSSDGSESDTSADEDDDD